MDGGDSGELSDPRARRPRRHRLGEPGRRKHTPRPGTLLGGDGVHLGTPRHLLGGRTGRTRAAGHPSVRAGSVIDLIYPTSRELQGSSVNTHASTVSGNTPFYSGRHLVTAVRHVLTQASPAAMEYTMHLEATRDSFGTKLVPYEVDEEDI